MWARRRASLAVALVGAAILCIVIYRTLPAPKRGPDRQRFELVVTGMSRPELIALCGPPGDYRSDRQRFSISHHTLQFAVGAEWVSDDGFLQVRFDSEGRVDKFAIRDVIDTRPSWRSRFGF
jgi:hypothetical protein